MCRFWETLEVAWYETDLRERLVVWAIYFLIGIASLGGLYALYRSGKEYQRTFDPKADLQAKEKIGTGELVLIIITLLMTCVFAVVTLCCYRCILCGCSRLGQANYILSLHQRGYADYVPTKLPSFADREQQRPAKLL